MNTAPVVMLVFNRPEPTRALLEQVRRARPETLLVIADGPRADRPADAAACAEVRGLITSGADWGAKVLTNYAPANLGLRARISSGLKWAFEQVDRAIILEDDCIPHPSFFPFCSELLERYRDDPRVGVIAGANFQRQPFACPASYYFSIYPHCWGWASWARAWQHFDNDLTNWPQLKSDQWLTRLFDNPLHAGYWEQIFDWVKARQVNSWAYAWVYSCWVRKYLTVLPRVNLVSNVGTGQSATHTHDHSDRMHFLETTPLPFPLTHPASVLVDRAADEHTQETIFGRGRPRTLAARLGRLRRKLFGAAAAG